MSCDQQVITQQDNNSLLNIPQASTLIKKNEEKQQLSRTQLIQQQSQIIENAFKEIDDSQCEVVIELEKSLVSELWTQLNERGYNIYQSMSYDSRDLEHHSGKYKVTITPFYKNDREGSQSINQMRVEMNNIISALKFPHYRSYPSLLYFPYLPHKLSQ